MAFTQKQHDALEEAISLGARSVEYDDGKKVEFRSLREMRDLLQQMRRELGLAPRGPLRSYPHHDKGLRD